MIDTDMDAICKPAFGCPTCLTVTRSGHLLVCDFTFGRILCLSGPNGQIVAKYGDALEGSAELVTPMGIAAFSDGRIIVTEVFTNRIQILK